MNAIQNVNTVCHFDIESFFGSISMFQDNSDDIFSPQVAVLCVPFMSSLNFLPWICDCTNSQHVPRQLSHDEVKRACFYVCALVYLCLYLNCYVWSVERWRERDNTCNCRVSCNSTYSWICIILKSRNWVRIYQQNILHAIHLLTKAQKPNGKKEEKRRKARVRLYSQQNASEKEWNEHKLYEA